MNTILLNQMLQLFLIMICGYGLFKSGIFNADLNKKLTRFLLDFTTPMLIISSVLNMESAPEYDKIGSVFLISFLFYVALTLLSIFFVKAIHYPKQQQGLYMFMHIFSNIGFMGFPIIDALYGKEAVLYTAILNIAFNLFAYTIGLILMHYKGSFENGLSSVVKLIDLKELFSPGTFGSLLAIVLYFLPVTFPEVITGAVTSIGGLTSPLAMLIIGSTLANMPVKQMFNDWHVYVFAILKQIVIPLLLWPVLRFAINDILVRDVFFILFLMPIGNTSVLFATRYNADERLAAKNVFVSTVLSIATIPLALSIANGFGQ